MTTPASPGVLVGKYVLEPRILGEGTFATVQRGYHTATGELCAIKRIRKNDISNAKNADARAMLSREVGAMRCLMGHPGIIRLKEAMQTTSNIYIVMELADKGSLMNRIHPGKGMPEDEARGYFQQIISAVDYCHKMQIAHRDIKPENILLGSKGALKITDFGLSNVQRKDQMGAIPHSLKLKSVCGTLHYVAPEVFSEESGYDVFAADVWSCGVVLYAMLCGGFPFRAKKETVMMDLIRGSSPYPCGWVPELAWRLVESLLTKDPLSRIQIPGVLVDPWFCVGFDRSVIRTSVDSKKTLKIMGIE